MADERRSSDGGPTDDGSAAVNPAARGGTEAATAYHRSLAVWSAAILVVAGVVRLLASLGDFWFDEIWSWTITLNLSSPWAIFTRIKHENNHFLNTLLISFIGHDAPWIYYRIPAVLAGVGSVALAGKLAAVRRRADKLTAMVLVGGSYLLIHYSSEARGYAYVVFFALLAVVLQVRALERDRSSTDLALAGTIVLGMLSHLVFLYCWASLLVWATLRAWRARRGFRSLVGSHVPPMLFSAWLYYINVRAMIVGGGQTLSPGEIVLSALSVSVGGPLAGPATWIIAVVAAAIFIAGLVYSVRLGSDWWVLYTGVIFVAPALLIWLAGRDLYVRYFVVAIAFALILVSWLLGELWSRGVAGKVAYCVLLVAFLLANGIPTARLIRLGRGQYERALLQIYEESPHLPTTVGSDHDFRNGLIFKYYRSYLPDPGSVYFYMLRDVRPTGGPDWFIRHSLETDYHPKPDYTDSRDNRYELVHVYPYAGLSGWSWAVYRNVRQLDP